MSLGHEILTTMQLGQRDYVVTDWPGQVNIQLYCDKQTFGSSYSFSLWSIEGHIRLVRLAYQPLASSTFLSEQTNHQ
jgi:hypothetical protein